MRTYAGLSVIAVVLSTTATAFPSLGTTPAMPKKAHVHAGVAATGGRRAQQGRRQLASKEIGAGTGGDPIQQAAFGLRGGAVESSTSTRLSAGLGIVEACGLAAPIASIFVSLSPFPTVRKILKDKSVGDLPLLPYSSLVANCFIWMVYGLLKSEPKVWSCNSFSTILGIYYFASFAKYCPKSSPTLPGSIALHFKTAVGTILATLAVAASFSKTKAASILGSAGVAICIALFASPLAALKTVFKTKSAESIPLPFAIAATVNCVLWFVVGWVDMKDINIWLPNGLGLACGLLQIVLKLVYGNGPSLAEAKQAA